MAVAFTSETEAKNWLVHHGFDQTASEGIWQNGDQMAHLCGASVSRGCVTDPYWARVQVVANRRAKVRR